MNLTKTLLGTLIVTGALFIPNVQTEVFASANNELCSVSSSSKVYLRGHLGASTTRSVYQSIEVFQEDKSLMVYYLNVFGKIEITISNNSNTIVYSEVISVSDKSKSFVDLSKFTEGIYVIKFKDSEGGELSGMFTVE